MRQHIPFNTRVATPIVESNLNAKERRKLSRKHLERKKEAPEVPDGPRVIRSACERSR